jgi:Flp pilus assembly protein TadG
MSIVAVLFVLLMLGLVDFAWDFLQLHMVTQATSVAARTVSALSHPCGDSSAQTALAKQIVTAQVSGYATVDPNNVTVKLMNQTKGATPCVTAGTKAQVTVQVTGTINDVFAMLLKKATLLNFTRTETFLDEGQS